MFSSELGLMNSFVRMVTTNSSKDDIIEALSAGVNNYLGKPMTAEALQEKIRACLDG